MEYLRITNPERAYGKRELLKTEISVLEALKHQQAYTKARMEELILKQRLRQLFIMMSDKVKESENWLPKVRTHDKKEHDVAKVLVKERRDLEVEIQALKEKLSLLAE